MNVDEFLDGESLTGRQAAIIFFSFLAIIVLSGIALVLLRGLFWVPARRSSASVLRSRGSARTASRVRGTEGRAPPWWR
jgi:hypothetical protein